jgi:hypothetical protein
MSKKVLSDLDFGGVARGINVPDPVNPQDVATRAYVLANRASTTETITGTDTVKVVTADALAALWERGTDNVDGATVTLGEGGYFVLTSTVTCTSIIFALHRLGRKATLYFNSIRTLVHGSPLYLPTGANIVTAAGDMCEVLAIAPGITIVSNYERVSGQALAVASMAANTVKVNATAGVASPTDLAVGTNAVLGRVAGNVVAAQLVNAQVTAGTLANASLVSMGDATVKGRALNAGTGAPQDLTRAEVAAILPDIADGTVMGRPRQAGAGARSALTRAQIADIVGIPPTVLGASTFLGNNSDQIRDGSQFNLVDLAGPGLTYGVTAQAGDYPSVVTISSAVEYQLFTGNPTAYQVTLPTERRVGDRIIVLLLTWYLGPRTQTLPAGWASFFSYTGGATVALAHERIIDGTEAATATFTNASGNVNSDAVAHVWLIRGSDPATATAAATVAETGFGSAVACPTLTPSFAASGLIRTLWITAIWGEAPQDVTAYPTGFSGANFVRRDTGSWPSDGFIGQCYKAAIGSSMSPSAFSTSATNYRDAVTFAIAPLKTGQIKLRSEIITFLQGLGYSGPV